MQDSCGNQDTINIKNTGGGWIQPYHRAAICYSYAGGGEFGPFPEINLYADNNTKRWKFQSMVIRFPDATDTWWGDTYGYCNWPNDQWPGPEPPCGAPEDCFEGSIFMDYYEWRCS